MRTLILLAAITLFGSAANAATPKQDPGHGPVIDMHIHAYGAGGEGPPSYVCTPFMAFKPLDPGKGGPGLPGYLKSMFGDPDCPHRVFSAGSDDELRIRTIAELRKNDVYAVAGGPPRYVDRWL